MRISPAAPRIRHSPPPTEADCAQAAALADVLATLIAECDARLGSLDADAAAARNDGSLRAARRIHAQSLELRRELEDLHAMDNRLIRRFLDPRFSRTAT